MMKKLTIGFLCSTGLLVLSEYLFLQEAFSHKRVAIIVVALAGIAAASFFFLRFFMKYHKSLYDS